MQRIILLFNMRLVIIPPLDKRHNDDDDDGPANPQNTKSLTKVALKANIIVVCRSATLW
jgi:hypothetical protein